MKKVKAKVINSSPAKKFWFKTGYGIREENLIPIGNWKKATVYTISENGATSDDGPLIELHTGEVFTDWDVSCWYEFTKNSK